MFSGWQTALGRFVDVAVILSVLLIADVCGRSDRLEGEEYVSSMTTTKRKNRLAGETSPYLLQHATNPVDWYPWGDEAFARARKEQKPIFLSIGYSACHWCHVMAHESFENDSTAALMNRDFINIKVDREERPDVDDIYMTFVQMATGGGGWPMSVFLTPDLKPFYGGTYFPPDELYGRPGFPTVLQGVAEAWRTRRNEIVQSSEHVAQQLKVALGHTQPGGAVAGNIMETAAKQLLVSFDAVNGGFGHAPKFPPSYALSFLMRYYVISRDERVLHALTHTLDQMARGGMYDQIGGGFHRYSVDSVWLVPHFEKMLYDNALLTVTYLDGFQLTGNSDYKRIAREILDYVLRDMTDSEGGFHSAEDADSEGEEGRFYLWTPDQVVDVLGEEQGRLICDYYGATREGNFENGKSILYLKTKAETFAEAHGIEMGEVQSTVDACKAKLLEARSRRVRPNKDDKILADWNGLMMTAFARGYQVTREPRYLEAARRCGKFIEKKLISKGGLMRTYRRGQVRLHGFLTDYAFVANAFVDLYESDFDVHWLRLAEKLTDEMIAKFADDERGGFFMTLANQNDLLVRQKDNLDGAIPAGNSVAAMLLCRLSHLLGKPEYRDRAEKVFTSVADQINRAPRGYLYLLNSLDLFRQGPREIALVGGKEGEGIASFLSEIAGEFLPNRTLALLDPEDPERPALEEYIPLLASRAMVEGHPTAYVCRQFACKLPVTAADALREQLRND
jgi:uncharacterized protein YyaL (SSP411 family)